MTEGALDFAVVNAFAARVLEDWGGAHTVALAYIGDRLGVFRALADGGPATSQDLADRTGLNERYLREWASALTAAEYIEYDPVDQTFAITPEKALVLAEEGHASFLGGGFQYAQACVQRVPELMDAFKHGGGVTFSEFGPEISEAIDRLFAAGYARDVATEWILALGEMHDRVSFELTPAEQIPHVEHFDLIVAFNCIHDMVDPRGALAGIQRALKPDGALLWSEANVSDRIEDNIGPQGELLYGTSAMHCMTVSLAHGGEGLGNVVGVETARDLAREAGFEHFERLEVENAVHQLFLATKASTEERQ